METLQNEPETFPGSTVDFETEVITENAGIIYDVGCERELHETHEKDISEQDQQQKPIVIKSAMRLGERKNKLSTQVKRQNSSYTEFGDVDFKYGDTRPFRRVLVISESRDDYKEENNLDQQKRVLNNKNENGDCDEDNLNTLRAKHIKRNCVSYSCPHCDYLSSIKSNLNSHIRQHTGEKPFSCTECNYTSKLKGNMKRHMLIHTGDKPHACTECKVTCAFKSELVTHMRIHSGEKPFSCQMCDFACKQKGQLKIHMSTHTEEKLFHCSGCEVSFKTKYQLRRHQVNCHLASTDPNKYYHKCPNCDYTCTRRDMLKRHMLRHEEYKPFACEECDYRCSRKEQLVVHMMSHTGEQLYICPQCKFTFTTQSDLEKHMVSHRDCCVVDLLRPWECPECNYKCAHRAHLAAHMLKHTGEKPFSCPECDYKCSLKGNLKQHMKRHSEEKPYACTECNYRSIHRKHLERHMHIHGVHPLGCTEFEGNLQDENNIEPNSDAAFSCHECSYRASHKHQLLKHLLSHSSRDEDDPDDKGLL